MSTSSTRVIARDQTVESALWWRVVLGEYPTGVCLLASRSTSGDIEAMIVGSFVAVSQSPPLVGLFVDSASGTFPRLAVSGKFTISVLGANQETVARAVASKQRNALLGADFASTERNIPRLADAVVWFDVSVQTRVPAGDHEFVLCEVEEFGLGNADAGMPLLYRRSGFGRFAAPSEAYDSRAFIERLAWAGLADAELTALARELGLPVTISTQLGDSVVILRHVEPGLPPRDTKREGSSHPFAAPVGAVFAAWAPHQRVHAWTEGARHLVGSVDRPLLAEQLAGVRERGYGVTGARSMGLDPHEMLPGSTAGGEALRQMWNDLNASVRVLQADGEVDWQKVSGIHVPVFNRDREVILCLSVGGLPQFQSARELEQVVRRVSLVTDALASRLPAAIAPSAVTHASQSRSGDGSNPADSRFSIDSTS